MGVLYSRLKCYCTRSVDHGYLKPQGIYCDQNNFDMGLVCNLILKGKLAPFYKGTNEICSNKKICFETECPICFLFYPSNINKTRCCHKAICTECFLQLKRSSPLIPAVCPFCVQPNLGVLYLPPPWSKRYNKKLMKSELYQDKSTKPNDSDIVLADTIRPVINNTRSSLAELTSQRRLQITESRRVENIIYDTTAQLDLEDILIMEAVRLSLNDAT